MLTIRKLSMSLDIGYKTPLPLIWIHSINGDVIRIKKALRKNPNGFIHIGYSPLITNYAYDIDRELYHERDDFCVIGPIDGYTLREVEERGRRMYIAGVCYFRNEWIPGRGYIRRQMVSLIESNDIPNKRRLMLVDKDWGLRGD